MKIGSCNADLVDILLGMSIKQSIIIIALTYTPPTLTGARPPTHGEYHQGLQLVALTG